jgi:hypothetical protein
MKLPEMLECSFCGEKVLFIKYLFKYFDMCLKNKEYFTENELGWRYSDAAISVTVNAKKIKSLNTLIIKLESVDMIDEKIKININVKEILTNYLRENEFDGLYLPGECACKIDDVGDVCNGYMLDCKPGYLCSCDCGEHDWHIGPKKEIENE